MCRVLAIIIGIMLSNPAYSQDWSRYWCFGDSAAIDFSDPSSPIIEYSEMDCSMSSASVGDSLNGLVMYAHAQYWPLFIQGNVRDAVIHNRYHSLMQNGSELIGTFHGSFVFLSKPDDDSLYFLFQCGFNPDDGLYYSIIEPHYNNDSGRVIVKNNQLPLTDNITMSQILTVRHANGRDWWVIVRNWDQSNKFNLFLVNPFSIVGPVEQNIGSLSTNSGGMTISKQGDRIALVNFNGLIEIYTFDRCSGVISNPVTIYDIPGTLFASCEFSPNGNVLYVSNTNNFSDSLRLYQFDLTASNIGASLKRIFVEKLPASGGLLKRGPDDKIYWTCLYSIGWPYPDSCRNIYNENLSVINDPDSLGAACNFSPFSFYLGGKRTYWNLPNTANFNLKNEVGSVCDTINVGIREEMVEPDILVYPNPSLGKFSVYCPIEINNIEIYNSLGISVKNIRSYGRLIAIDLSNFEKGLYIIKLNNKYVRKVVIESE